MNYDIWIDGFVIMCLYCIRWSSISIAIYIYIYMFYNAWMRIVAIATFLLFKFCMISSMGIYSRLHPN